MPNTMKRMKTWQQSDVILFEDAVIASDYHPLIILRFLAVKFMLLLCGTLSGGNCSKQVNANTKARFQKNCVCVCVYVEPCIITMHL